MPLAYPLIHAPIALTDRIDRLRAALRGGSLRYHESALRMAPLSGSSDLFRLLCPTDHSDSRFRPTTPTVLSDRSVRLASPTIFSDRKNQNNMPRTAHPIRIPHSSGNFPPALFQGSSRPATTSPALPPTDTANTTVASGAR